MRAILLFISILAAAFIVGALLSYPVYSVFSAMMDVRFHKIISKTTLLSGLVFSLLYLQLCGSLTFKSLGLPARHALDFKQLVLAIAAGLLVILCINVSLLCLQIYEIDPNADTGALTLASISIKALFTALLVGMFEETIFRGALYSALNRQLNAVIAILFTGILYAAAHYIKFRAVPPGMEIGWLTGLMIFPEALFRFSDPEIIDSFLTLFVLAILLGLIRARTNSIIPCIGFHAGVVATLKIATTLTDYSPLAPYPFLVNKYEQQFGYVAIIWLLIAIVIYYFLSIRGNTPVLWARHTVNKD